MVRYLFALLLFTSSVLAEPMALPGYTWDSPVKFGEVQELGPDAYFATYPADVEYGQAQLELIVVHTPRDAVAMMQEGGADPKSDTLVIFLGLAVQPDEINKTLFMGSTEARLVFESSVPRQHTAHVYQKYLQDGALVTVGVRDFGSKSLIADVLRGISETFASTSVSGE